MENEYDLTNVATIDSGGFVEINLGSMKYVTDILIVGESSSYAY